MLVSGVWLDDSDAAKIGAVAAKDETANGKK